MEAPIEVVAVHCVIGITGVQDPEAVLVTVVAEPGRVTVLTPPDTVLVTVETPPDAVVVTVPPGRVTVLTPPDTVLVTVPPGSVIVLVAAEQEPVSFTVVVRVEADPTIEVVAVHCVIGITGVQDPEAVVVTVPPGSVTVLVAAEQVEVSSFVTVEVTTLVTVETPALWLSVLVTVTVDADADADSIEVTVTVEADPEATEVTVTVEADPVADSIEVTVTVDAGLQYPDWLSVLVTVLAGGHVPVPPTGVVELVLDQP